MNEDFTQVSGHAAVLRRRGWIIVLAALLGGVLGALAAPLLASSYSAESVVLVPVARDSADPTLVDTQVEVVTSDDVVRRAVAELGDGTEADELRDSLTVAVVPDTTAISITAARATSADAIAVADAFATAYVTFSRESVTEDRASTVEELERQLDEASGRLVSLQRDVDGLTGLDLAEARAAITRQQQRQARVIDRLAEAQDPTTVPRSADVLQEAVASGGGDGRLRAGLFGAVLGFLVGLVIAYARHASDDRIRDEDELVRLVGSTPILGRIPRTSTGSRGGGVVGDPGSKTAEAYRGLAVNLRLRVEHPRSAGGTGTGTGTAPVAGAGVMALIISASPGEGKSSVAGDLALTAAGMGLRVVLVDADLRNPQLAGRFGTPAGPGLTDLLLQDTVSTPRPVEVGIDNLRLLPAGVMHADPATLLSRANATTVWDALRAENDLVVVDTAPVLYAAETLELATEADRVVMVVERSRTTRRDVRTVVERMQLVGATPSGAVLTKVPARDVVGGYYPRQP